MNYNGTINLIAADGKEILHSFAYTSREERKKIVDRWKRTYEDYYHLCCLAIIPNVYVPSVKVSPEAKKRLAEEKLARLQERSSGRHKQFTRPAAVYNNIPTYNYEK